MSFSYTTFRPMQHTIEDIHKAQVNYKYVFITILNPSTFLSQFDSFYQPGVYYIASNGDIYHVKNPGFLYANNLTIKNSEI